MQKICTELLFQRIQLNEFKFGVTNKNNISNLQNDTRKSNHVDTEFFPTNSSHMFFVINKVISRAVLPDNFSLVAKKKYKKLTRYNLVFLKCLSQVLKLCKVKMLKHLLHQRIL